MECYWYLRNIQDLLSDRKTPYQTRFGMPFDGPAIPFGAMVEHHPISAKHLPKTTSVWHKSLARYILRLCIIRGGNLGRRHFGRRH